MFLLLIFTAAGRLVESQWERQCLYFGLKMMSPRPECSRICAHAMEGRESLSW